jgi:uncharacterized protein
MQEFYAFPDFEVRTVMGVFRFVRLSIVNYRLPTTPFATVPIRHKEPLMPIPQDLLDILVCPACKAPVRPTPHNSGLKCQACRRVYPVRDDIPVMLVEEATIAPE